MHPIVQNDETNPTSEAPQRKPRRGRGLGTIEAMTSGSEDRAYWLNVLKRLATPVLRAAAGGKLRATMPVEVRPGDPPSSRAPFTHLEAVARLLCGIAPWLELE